MKIAIACPYAWDAPGGVQVHVRQLAARLRAREHEVLIVAPGFDADLEGATWAGRPMRVPYNGSIAPICFSPPSIGRTRRALESFAPDVIHAHEPLTPSTAMFAVRPKLAPVVATFHAGAEKARLVSAVAPALKQVWKRLDVRLAVSEAARELVSTRLGPEPVRVVPNGVEVEKFAAGVPAELPPGRRILFVNRLDARKGFSTMVDTFARLAANYEDAVLVVAGDGQDRTAVERLAPSARARVVMLGNVAHDDLPAFHAACDVFCAPTTGRESFGIVLVEAMAAGLPVVASDIAGYREVVRDRVDGLLVPPRDPESIARAIGSVLDNPGLAGQLAEAGRARAPRFSWDVVAAEIEEIYAEARILR